MGEGKARCESEEKVGGEEIHKQDYQQKYCISVTVT